MPRSINKIKVYFYFFSLIVLSSILNVNISDNLKKLFLVEILEVNNHSNDLKEIMYNQIEFTLNQNILNLDQSFINQKLNNLKIFETIEVKKKYPNKLVIFAKKTDFIAIGFKEGKKYYVGNNSNLIPKDLVHTKKNLPIIFGDFKVNDFLILKDILTKLDYNLTNINKFYYHKNNRWDIYFNNGILLMLPNKNLEDTLDKYRAFKNNNKISKNSIIDLRVKNRIVIKNMFDVSLELGLTAEEHLSLAGLPVSRRSSKALIKDYHAAEEVLRASQMTEVVVETATPATPDLDSPPPVPEVEAVEEEDSGPQPGQTTLF